MRIILALLLLALAGLSYQQFDKASKATKEAIAAKEELATAQGQLENVDNRIDAAKKDAAEARKKLGEINELKSQLTDTQRKLEESTKQMADTQAGAEETKKQLTEVDALKEKLIAAEAAIAAAREETTAAKAEAAAARAEVARMQAAAAKPPLGSAMEKKR